MRGEVYLDRSDFQRLNKEREEIWRDAFRMNPRTPPPARSLQDSAEVARRRLRLWAYYLEAEDHDLPDSDYERMQLLRAWGFPVVETLPPPPGRCMGVYHTVGKREKAGA